MAGRKSPAAPPSSAKKTSGSSDLSNLSCMRLPSSLTTTPSAKSDSLQDAPRRGRKLMGKPVRFRRGIATVIPERASGTVSQIASLRGFSDVCE